MATSTKAITSLATGENIARIYCFTNQGNVYEAPASALADFVATGEADFSAQIAALQAQIDEIKQEFPKWKSQQTNS